MNSDPLKNFLPILIIFFTVMSMPIAFGQITFGEPALVTDVKVTITKEGKVHVIHELKGSSNTVTFNSIKGDVSNLKVIDVDGNELQYATTGGESIGIMVFPSRSDILVEYDLDNVLFLNDGTWKMDFRYLQTVVFNLPENLDMIFVNDIPVLLDETNSIRCHGCQMVLEYSFSEPVITEKIKWEDQNFELKIQSFGEIDSFNFNQTTKSISFDFKGESQFLTLVIPTSFLGNPYEVFLDDEKIFKHEFFQNETHAWLNVRPANSGTITVIGTTVVPEFSIFAPLFVGLAAVIIMQFKNKIILR